MLSFFSSPYVLSAMTFVAGYLVDHFFGSKIQADASVEMKALLADMGSEIARIGSKVAPKPAPAPVVKPMTETEANTHATKENTAALESHGKLLVAHAEVVKAAAAATVKAVMPPVAVEAQKA